MRISIATPKAIRYACLNFHYAKAVPGNKYSFNVFNDKDEWCGIIMYGYGANSQIAKPFGLYQGEVLELVRAALNGKQETTSKAVAMTLRELHKIAPHIKLVVSYADLDQEHAGIIYQATNWIYLGKYNEGSVHAFILNGKKTHTKTIGNRYGTSSFTYIKKHIDTNAKQFITKGKHKYIFVFDKKLRKKWLEQSKPYPKRGDNNGTGRFNTDERTN